MELNSEIGKHTLPDYQPEKLLETMDSAFEAYLENGPRSTKKLDILHGYIISCLENLGRTAKGKNGTKEGQEIRVPGRFVDKNVDIALIGNEGAVSYAVFVKFPLSNWKQNSNNYLESALGETLNLRRNGVKVSHMIFLPRELPYFRKDGTVFKKETITDKDIDKYRKLYKEMCSSNSGDLPNSLLIILVDLWNFRDGKAEPKRASFSDLSAFSVENQVFLKEVGDYDCFLRNL